ncbi:hypothetical protein BO82DRAFT_408212 [Aspergillus uvarum CBS 121591]|uniref:Aminoglycoside phosphotransferase domain-containing protein n=1 Tax=Aspergillus uvarum CBS 121591 TaxID=1448315 RepID=A0A319DG37_9EURO|nr:hypothetical protein BO82DRAFT_408212 [Aspergillus uvarum CBS 121591]PYH87078.1 hypothetical protein BO82DRAFT_408212 [Aspergillus uvarum CBS 121591]
MSAEVHKIYLHPTSHATDLPFPLDNIPLTTIPNTTLAAQLYKAPALHGFGQTTVVRLSQSLILKGGGNILPPEAAALRLLASAEPYKTIRAPRVHRAFQVPDDTKYFGTTGYLVIDYIPGRPLDTCWEGLPADQKIDIAGQGAEMITAIQRVHLPGPPGPIGNGNGADEGKWPCRGRFFTHYSAGPFGRVAEFEGWFNHKLDICQQVRKAAPDVPAFRFRDFQALVLERLHRDPVVERQLGAIEYGLLTAALA